MDGLFGLSKMDFQIVIVPLFHGFDAYCDMDAVIIYSTIDIIDIIYTEYMPIISPAAVVHFCFNIWNI